MTCTSVRNPGKNISESEYLKNTTFTVHKAACLHKNKVSESDMMMFLSQLRDSEPLPWAVVNNVKFLNESPARLEIYHQLTSVKSSTGRSYKIRNENLIVMDPDTAIIFHPNCMDVLCAVQEVFGKQVGLRLAYLYGKYQLNGSHLRYSLSSIYTIAELDEVLMALQDLPQDFFPIGADIQLTRFLRNEQSDRGIHPCILADSTMRLFDAWEIASSDFKRETLIHEMAHAIAQKSFSDIDLSEDWLALSTWKQAPYTSITKKTGIYRQEFVSDYAMTQPREDFAESFTAYVYQPALLRNHNFGKYEFLRDRIFKGKEFSDPNNCPR